MSRLLATLVLITACATVPLDAPRGELVVVSDTGDAQVKAIELQHQDYTHAISISGFEPGHDTVRKETIAGHYCVERLIFDTGPAGGVVIPQNMCFDVAPDEPTEVRVVVTEDGQIALRTERANPIDEPEPPMAGPD